MPSTVTKKSKTSNKVKKLTKKAVSSDEETKVQHTSPSVGKKVKKDKKEPKKVVKKESSSSDSSSSSEEEKVTKKVAKVVKKDESESDSSSSSSSSEDEKVVSKKTEKVAKKDDSSSSDSSSSDSSSSEDEKVTKKAKVEKVAKKEDSSSSDSSSSDSSSSDSSEDEKVTEKAEKLAKKDDSSSDSSDSSSSSEDEKVVKKAKKDDSSDSSDSSSSDEETVAKETKAKKEDSDSSDSSSSSSDSSSSETEEEKPTLKRKAEESPAKPAVQAAEKKAKTENAGSTTIFIGNLPWTITDEELVSTFQECGEVKETRIIKDREGRIKGFGYVEFADSASVTKAVEGSWEIGGRTIRVDVSNSAPQPKQERRAEKPQSPPSAILFMGNLAFQVTEDELRAIFSKHGSIMNMRFPTDKETGAFKGFGYVEFASVDEAVKAVENVNGMNIAGRSIRLDYSQPRDNNGEGQRGGRGGRGGRGAPRGGRGGRGGNKSFPQHTGTKVTFD